MIYPEFCYIETALGKISNRGRICKLPELNHHNLAGENYVSMYRFDNSLYRYHQIHGTVAKMPPTRVWSDYTWIDIDNSDLNQSLEAVRDIGNRLDFLLGDDIENIKFYFSGAKGFHIGIPTHLIGLEPSPDLPNKQKDFVEKLCFGVDIDISLYNQLRLFRIANSLNDKSSLYKTQLSFNQIQHLSINDIKNLASKSQGLQYVDLLQDQQKFPANIEMLDILNHLHRDLNLVEPTTPTTKTDSNENMEGWISDTLTNMRSGNRHIGFTRVIGKLLNDDYSTNDIKAILSPHAANHDFIPEFNILVDDLIKRYGDSFTPNTINSSKQKNEFNTVSLKDFLRDTDTTITWIVDGLIAEETATIIGGYPGAGKSFLLMDLALSIATGTDFLGFFPTKVGRVLYIDEENAKPLIANRFKLLSNGRRIHETPENIIIAAGRNLKLDSKNGFAKIWHKIEEFKPSIIIIDSFIRVHKAEENSASEMSRVNSVIKQLIQAHSVSFVFADHVRKQRTQNTSGGLALRGSSDKWAFVDSLITASKKKNLITITHAKSRYAEPCNNVVVNLYSNENATYLKFDHEEEELVGLSKLQIAEDFVKQNIGENWVFRKDIIALAAKNNIKAATAGKALTALVKRKVLVVDEEKFEGPGKPQNKFKRNPEYEEFS